MHIESRFDEGRVAGKRHASDRERCPVLWNVNAAEGVTESKACIQATEARSVNIMFSGRLKLSW